MNQFFIAGNASLQATGISAHPTSESVAVVTFSNGQRALVSKNLSKGYFQAATDANGTPGIVPVFLSNTGLLMPGYEIAVINGTPWVQSSGNRKGISLPS